MDILKCKFQNYIVNLIYCQYDLIFFLIYWWQLVMKFSNISYIIDVIFRSCVNYNLIDGQYLSEFFY